jgi:hypothetical protein
MGETAALHCKHINTLKYTFNAIERVNAWRVGRVGRAMLLLGSDGS